MTAVRFPAWDHDEKAVDMDKGKAWSKCRDVCIRNYVPDETLNTAAARLQNVVRLRCDKLYSEQLHTVLNMLHCAPRLRALEVCGYLTAETAGALAAALLGTQELRQLLFWIDGNVFEQQRVLQTLAVLPLRALRVVCISVDELQCEHVFDATAKLHATLQSLEIEAPVPVRLTRPDFVLNSLKQCRALRILRLRGVMFRGSGNTLICDGIAQLRQLRDLHLSFLDGEGFVQLAKMFSAPACQICLTRLAVEGAHLSKENARLFFESLSSMCVYDLHVLLRTFPHQAVAGLLESRLVVAGWLRKFRLEDVVDRPVANEFFLASLKKNQGRHEQCRAWCLCWLALNKRRNIISPDMARMIAMFVWMTRNKKVWRRKRK